MKKKHILIILSLACFCIALFLLYLSFSINKRGMKDLKDLTHATGIINQHRTIRHYNNPVGNRGQQTVMDVTAFKIEGNSNEFAIIQPSQEIKEKIENKIGLFADIYFNVNGKRIEENVISDILNLSINNTNYINIEDVKSQAGRDTAILLSAGTVLIIMAIAVFIKVIKI